ncbi:hypothetical protein [Micromonospora antibiotica]|uniref:Uncharacterized protein n=1 Tax=Micromonospora antibiotica TaxID=2807623 RepID=A0ABS3V124_9ACTN|nr:hypothetical protein [Micromonospora antibiotica]MBO4159304.1 hypothetical protein [Micromonospora antibiotica]
MFGKKTTVPNTITDRQVDDLNRRAQRTNPQMFTPEAIKKRLATQEQQREADQS